MDTGIKVGDCMKTTLITIDESASIFDTAKKMSDAKVGSLLVEKNGKITGIITDSDLVRKCLAKKNTHCTVGEVATHPLVTIGPEMDLSEAARLMGTKKLRRLVVMQGNHTVGIISSTDITKISPSLYDLIAQKQVLERAARN